MSDQVKNVSDEINLVFRQTLEKKEVDLATIEQLLAKLGGEKLPKTDELLALYRSAVNGGAQ